MDLVTLFAAAIDTVPSTVPSTVPAPSPDGGGGGVLAWWDDLVPVIAALVGAGLGFLASYVQSKKDRAHAENAAQRQAVADFLAEYGALVGEERRAKFEDKAMSATPSRVTIRGGTQHLLSADEYFECVRDKVREMSEPLWQRFETAHNVLQFHLIDAEVAKAADDFRRKATGIRAEALASTKPWEGAKAAASVFSGGQSCGADQFEMVAKSNLIGPREKLPTRDRLAINRRGLAWCLRTKLRPRKRGVTPAADAGPNE